MAKETRKFAATSNIIRVWIADSSSTTGAGLTGVLYTSTGLVIDLIADNSNTVYHYQSAATATIQDITTIGTFAAPSASNCRFKAVDGTNLPGLYEIQFLDGVFDDASSKRLIGCVRGVTNMAPTWFEIELVAYDPQDTVRLGLTALPNAAAEAAGGLYTRGTGAGQINQDANGRVDVSLKAILGTTLTETAGQIAAAFKKFFDKATPTGTINSIPDAVAGANGGLPTVDAANRIVGIQGTKHTFDDLNDVSQANIRTAVGLASANLDTQIATLATLTKMLKYVQLLARKDAAIATDNATELTAINANGGSGAGAYDNTTDAQEALRDRGDASWTTVTAAAIRTAVGLASANLDTQIGTLATPAQVNAEVVDALNVDTYAEPGQGTPAATTTLAAKINYLYKNWRNKKTQTSSQWSLLNDDAATVDQKAAVADDGTTASKDEIATGP